MVNYSIGRFVVIEADKNLVDHDVIKHFDARGAQSFGKVTSVIAASIH